MMLAEHQSLVRENNRLGERAPCISLSARSFVGIRRWLAGCEDTVVVTVSTRHDDARRRTTSSSSCC